MAQAHNPTVAEFRAKFGEFSTLDDGIVQGYIGDSALLYARDDDIRLYLIAHLCALHGERGTKPDGGSGVIERERIGQREAYYSKVAEDEAFYERTSYGRMYRQLLKRDPTYSLGMLII